MRRGAAMLAAGVAAGGSGLVSGYDIWYKADAIVGLVNNDPVATWEDSSGTNEDATQATGSKQPLYKTNVVNSLPAVLFDGTDDEMSFSPSSPLFVNDCTIHVVAALSSHPDTAKDVAVIGSRAAAWGALTWRRRTSDGNTWGLYGSGDGEWRDTGEAITIGEWKVMTLRLDAGNQVTLRLNGVEKYNSTASVSAGLWLASSQRLGTGRTVNTNPSYFHGHIAEYVGYGTEVLSNADMEANEDALMTKYGL